MRVDTEWEKVMYFFILKRIKGLHRLDLLCYLCMSMSGRCVTLELNNALFWHLCKLSISLWMYEHSNAGFWPRLASVFQDSIANYWLSGHFFMWCTNSNDCTVDKLRCGVFAHFIRAIYTKARLHSHNSPPISYTVTIIAHNHHFYNVRYCTVVILCLFEHFSLCWVTIIIITSCCWDLPACHTWSGSSPALTVRL